MARNGHINGLYVFTFLFTITISIHNFQYAEGQHLACENRHPEGHSAAKRHGDGGFQITVTGKEAYRGYYVPNEVYTVKIHGVKTRYSNQKFTEFLIVAESEKQATMGHAGLVTTGIFHIIDDTQTRFSDNCPDGVTNLRPQPKTEVSVLWSAPSVLIASCISLKVTLVERPQVWYMDDGNLTKVLCPEFPFTTSVTTTPHPFTRRQLVESLLLTRSLPTPNSNTNANHLHHKNEEDNKESMLQNIMKMYSNISALENAVIPQEVESPPIIDDLSVEENGDPDKCCACDEAKYEVIFEGLWSKETHPRDFPENEWLLHFSDIIGASHSKDYYFWKAGEPASEGIRQVAEWGATRHLENELKSKSRNINTIIKARGLWHPNEQGRTSAAFRVDKNHHLMSLVSMVGPSPDWIVGVSGFELCTKNCTWLSEGNYYLYPFDAGTDSGVSYMSPNLPTNPRAAIKEITTSDPADVRSPFYDPSGQEEIKPFAKIYIRRQRIYPKNCNDSSSSDAIHEILFAENTEEINRPECAVTEWTPWSDCSVVCGKGLRMRKRTYVIPMKAQMMACDRQLVEKEMCLGQTEICDPDSEGVEELDSICAVTEWSNWTPCSVTCGQGTKSRSRRYKNHIGRKRCTLTMTQSESCTGMKEHCNPNEEQEASNDPDCPLTPWSEWSPCSVPCGMGIRERSRAFLFVEEETKPRKCNSIETKQQASCLGDLGSDCTIGVETAKEICMLEPDSGPCRGGDRRKYYFHSEKMMCTVFSYGGCKGNRNRFDTLEECNDVCGFLNPHFSAPRDSNGAERSNERQAEENQENNLDLGRYSRPRTAIAVIPEELDREIIEPENVGDSTPAKVDCVVSEWSEWSLCSVTCGVGVVTRTRNIVVQPQNDGRRCPRRLRKAKPCRLPLC